MGVPIDYARRTLLDALTGAGFDLFHVAVGDGNDLAEWAQLIAEYPGTQMLVQLDAAYLQTPTSSEVEEKAVVAIDGMAAAKGDSTILAFSIREEPTLQHMPFLDKYYGILRAATPKAEFFLLHNDRKTIAYPLVNRPNLLGTDRYAFWGWDPSDGGYSATPDSALRWFDLELQHFGSAAAKHDAVFYSVFTNIVALASTSTEAVQSGVHGDAGRITTYAGKRLSGWRHSTVGKLDYVKYYEPPVNATRAMVWVSAINGADGVLNWFADIDQVTDHGASDAHETYVYKASILADGQLKPIVKEFARAVCEIREYGAIFAQLQAVEQVNPISVPNGVISRVHQVRGVNGLIVSVVNSQLGDEIVRSEVRIDQDGRLLNFNPSIAGRQLDAKLRQDQPVFDVLTERELDRTNGIELWLEPGAGRLLYFGSPTGFRELIRLKNESVSQSSRDICPV